MSVSQAVVDLQPPSYVIHFESYLRPKQPSKCQPLQRFVQPKPPGKLRRLLRRCQQRCQQLPLPSFLSFLRAREDDGLCKRKTGFEFYCEIASIHGFHIFPGAKTWQRVLWSLLICAAVLMSLIVLIMSIALTEHTPTLRYLESLQEPTANIQFPAVTICSLNRVSKAKLLASAKQLAVSAQTLQHLPWLGRQRAAAVNQTELQQLENGNLSWPALLEQLSPALCSAQLLSCKWQGRLQRCPELFRSFWTSSSGLCCTFGYDTVLLTPHWGQAKGLSVRLANQREDYGSVGKALSGFEVMIHSRAAVPGIGTQRALLPSSKEALLSVRPYSNYATSYISGLKLSKRRCYLPGERKLYYFGNYNQYNCLAECRSQRYYQQCGCVPPYEPRQPKWPICSLTSAACLRLHSNISWQWTETDSELDLTDIHYMCNCWPSCQFNRYELQSEVVPMNASYVNVYDEFFNGFNVTKETLLHIYYDTLVAEQLRLDVYENWLTFIGTFGGITGLFMGCSFVSVFELIFLTCVRPICNWLSRQQIRQRQRQERRRVEPLAGH